MKDKPTQFTSMAQQRRFEAQQREIERIRNEKKETTTSSDAQTGKQPNCRQGRQG